MANYTQSVREILQYYKQSGEDLTNVSDVYAIASRTLFQGVPVSMIGSDYVQPFVTGFTLHFMNEELGYETLPLWKIALNEKIFNNASYINLIFENLDKQIFADYNVKSANKTGSIDTTKETSGTVGVERDVTEGGSQTDSGTYSETVNKDVSDVYTDDTTATTTMHGSELHSTVGSDELKKEGSETRNKLGTDVLTKAGSEETAQSGTDTTTDDTSNLNKRSSGTQSFTNGMTVQYDTPMGQLAGNMHTSGGGADGITVTGGSGAYAIDTYSPEDPTGEGYNYSEGLTYNYMSAAGETGQTQTNVENGNDNSVTHQVTEMDHGLTATTTFDDRTDSTEYDSHEEMSYGVNAQGQTAERKDTTTYGKSENVRYGLYDDGVTSGGVADSRYDETVTDKDTERTLSDDTATSGSKSDTTTFGKTMSDDSTQTTAMNEVTGTDTVDSEHETNYNINWEMIYRSTTWLNKVWEIFDDLFMQIF